MGLCPATIPNKRQNQEENSLTIDLNYTFSWQKGIKVTKEYLYDTYKLLNLHHYIFSKKILACSISPCDHEGTSVKKRHTHNTKTAIK